MLVGRVRASTRNAMRGARHRYDVGKIRSRGALISFFLPRGAEAFRRDIPDARIHFFDTGHFALETHAKDIAAAIRDFVR